LALYTIGDLHLSLSSDKPMDVFGGGWENYQEKIRQGFSTLKPDDVCVLCGDISWGMTIKESMEDFRFIENLPGRKILLKGNHDYWWETVTKIKKAFAENGISSIDILHNNAFSYNGYAICGTRGWLLENEADAVHNAKITAREAARLRASLNAADSSDIKLCFLHFPPRYRDQSCQEIIEVMKEYGVKNCYYGHIHGYGQHYAAVGESDGINYHMVSADYVGFIPQEVTT